MNGWKNLDWEEIRERLAKFATSHPAKERLLSLSPLSNPDEALQSFRSIDDGLDILRGGQRPFAESLDLFSSWFQRLEKKAVLKPLELRDVRHFCLEIIALREVLQNYKENSWSKTTLTQVMKAEEPLAAIDQIMTPEGNIRNDASEKLYQLHSEKHQLIKKVQSSLDRLIHDHDMDSLLQDKYVTTREGRWVLPIKSGMQHDFQGLIHAASQSKQTVFMEPEVVVPDNNRLRTIETEIEEEIQRLLNELSLYLSGRLTELRLSRQALEEADVLLAKSQLTQYINGESCYFSEDELRLSDVRHPLLVLNQEKVVSNSVHLTKEKNILLLSGPNAGGKTVLLKAIGLAAQMARCGLPPCAGEESILPFTKEIVVAIGDSQSIDEQLSTFAAHVSILNQALQYEGSQTLLLIDEICGSTDPEEGSALARGFVEQYAAQGVFAVVTSHLGPLKLGWTEESGVVNGSLEYDNQTGQPTYQFLMGVPGRSLAIETARRVGVSPQVLERAFHFLSPEVRAHHNHVMEAEELKRQLQELKQKLHQELETTRKQKSKYKELQSEFERKKEELLRSAVKKGEKEIENLVKQAKVSDIFRRHTELQKVKSELPKVVKPSNTSESKGSVSSSPEEFATSFPPGSTVFISSLNRDGIVQGIPNSRGEVPILSQSMRLSVPWHELKAPQKVANPTKRLVRQATTSSYSLKESQRVIDLRGQKVEEALEELEVQLDAAAVNQEDRVKVVHGHGTEALKKAVRGYLSRSTYVGSWSAGTKESGGDGITWIELRQP